MLFRSVIATLNSQKEKPNQIKVNTVESKDKAVVQIEEPRSIKNLFVVNQDFFAYNLNDQFVFSRDELSWKIIDNKEKSVVVSGEFNDENSEEQEKSLEEMKEAMRRYSKKSSDDESEEIELITTIENFKEIKIIVPSEEEEELKDDQDKRSAKNNNSTQKQASQKPLAPKEKETPLVPINKNNQKPKVASLFHL